MAPKPAAADPRVLDLAKRSHLPVDVLADAVDACRAAIRAFPHRPPADVAKYFEIPDAVLSTVSMDLEAAKRLHPGRHSPS